MRLTWLDSNSWLLELGEKRILLDPWLVGSLTFGNLNWLFQGTKTVTRPIPENIDLILLSQGLEDHAHPPTLKALSRSIPVVGSPAAIKVAAELGYGDLTALTHGQEHRFGDITIKAVKGSPIGPTTVENGYIIRTIAGSIYYEPHGYHDRSLKDEGPIDVVITPIIDLKIPLLGPVIKGQTSALEACRILKPKVIVPTAAGGDIKFEGLLMSILSASGGVEEFKSLLEEKSLDTKVIDPEPWRAFTVS